MIEETVILTKTRQTAGLTEWKSVAYDENSSLVARHSSSVVGRQSFASLKSSSTTVATHRDTRGKFEVSPALDC